MLLFLIPLLLGFTFNSASAFTTYFSRHLGERRGRLVCTILRNVLGIPLWAIGFIMAAQADSVRLFNPLLISSTLGWLMILMGATIIFVGIFALKWRAATPSVQDTLVIHGIYAHIRHPIYSGMILQLTGLSLLLPTLTMIVACALGVLWIFIQARLEELDLVERLPAYKDYISQVPRFVPRLK